MADAGPLADAAARLLERERVPALRGAAALRWLARAIDAFAERDPSPREEAAFVEGAGALLGLVLVDHLGGAHAERDGVHRVRLGARGFFDPFAVIEAALEAERAQDVLVAAVARAEREARGEAGVGRAAAIFERLLAERRPDLEVRERFDRRLWLGDGIEVDLGRAIDATEGQDERALEQALVRLLDMLPGGPGLRPIDREEALARMLPRIVGPGLALEGLFARPLAHGASIALVLSYEGRARFVRTDEITAWGLQAEAAIRHAIARLAARSGGARLLRVDTEDGPFVVAASGDGLDAARLLLPGLHDVLAPELGTPFLAAIPHRDTLIACTQSEPMRRALEARARRDAMRAPHAITDGLFEVSARGVRAA